jgi:hypothetical protein
MARFLFRKIQEFLGQIESGCQIPGYGSLLLSKIPGIFDD